jgi:hypothetical protein
MRFSYKAAALVAVCMAAASSTAAAQASIIFPGGCVPCSSCVVSQCDICIFMRVCACMLAGMLLFCVTQLHS